VTAILTNVPIKDLLAVLNKLASQYDMVDIIINPEEKRIVIDPVEKDIDDSELTDDNIYKLV
jgi:hypothetical protein